MFKLIEGLPPNVLAVEATGKVTHEDYRDILIPRAEALMGQGKLKMLYALDSDVSGFELEAIWDDASFGARHWSGFDAVAIVTDIGWIRAAVTMFTPLIPAKVKLFGLAEMAQAKEWIVGAS
jgi:SpoIIAA-like